MGHDQLFVFLFFHTGSRGEMALCQVYGWAWLCVLLLCLLRPVHSTCSAQTPTPFGTGATFKINDTSTYQAVSFQSSSALTIYSFSPTMVSLSTPNLTSRYIINPLTLPFWRLFTLPTIFPFPPPLPPHLTQQVERRTSGPL